MRSKTGDVASHRNCLVPESLAENVSLVGFSIADYKINAGGGEPVHPPAKTAYVLVCESAGIVFSEDPPGADREWWVHVNEVATLSMFKDGLEIAIQETGRLQSARTSLEETLLGKISAPVAAVGDVELPV
jgi:hypothetical protein